MQFNSLDFAIFFIFVLTVYWFIVKWQLARTLFLLGASYFFYMYWNPYFISLIIISTMVDFFAGKQIYLSANKKRARRFLLLSLFVNLGLLGFFKYANFFTTSSIALLNCFGFKLSQVHLNILLPVGISFYTFQTMSYSLDIYFGKLKPEPSFLKFALFVSFFPQLVAGPIVRAKTFLPQISSPKTLTAETASRGVYLILKGLVKKIVIADFLALNLIDRVFDMPYAYTSLEVLVAIYAYAMQIYGDFSGYSDIAIGAAMLMGYELPENFRAPYMAINLRDFWRRWHITLSTWLRDYLYIPLGGSRISGLRTYANLFVTMLLGGLWHGDNWTFVIWGALHGTGLAATRFFQKNVFKNQEPSKNIAISIIKIALTFHFVVFCWIFFRSPDFETAFYIIKRIFAFIPGSANIGLKTVIVLGTAYLIHWLPFNLKKFIENKFVSAPAIIQGPIIFAIFALLHTFSSAGVVPFIYFQF